MQTELASPDNATKMRELIREYKNTNPSASTRGLSREIEIPASSLSKIENLQKDPTLEEMLKILSGTGNLHRVNEILEEFSPELSRLFETKIAYGTKVEFHPVELDPFFSEEVPCIIVLMAACEFGTTREEISNLYGVVGIQSLEKLLSDKILVENDDNAIKFKDATFRQLKPRELRNVLKHCLNSFYRENKYGTGQNWISFFAQSVDKEKVVPKARAILDKAFKDINKLMQDEANRGNDKLFLGMVMDLFGSLSQEDHQ
jgi:hypothetical protein